MQTTPADTYVTDATYHALKSALARLVAQPFDREGTDPETEVIAALGEVGGIWPQSVLDDPERSAAA